MHWVCYACYPQAMGAQVREARERARAAASEAAAAASDALNAAMAVAISDRHQAADIFVAVAADAEAIAGTAKTKPQLYSPPSVDGPTGPPPVGPFFGY